MEFGCDRELVRDVLLVIEGRRDIERAGEREKAPFLFPLPLLLFVCLSLEGEKAEIFERRRKCSENFIFFFNSRAKTMPSTTKKSAAAAPQEKKRDFLDESDDDDDAQQPVAALEQQQQPKLRVNEGFAKRLEVRKKEEVKALKRLALPNVGEFDPFSTFLSLVLLRRASRDHDYCIYVIGDHKE